MSKEQLDKVAMEQEIARLKAENAKLIAAKSKPLSLKVSANTKALSVYGLGRFPTTLYKQQWEKLLDNAQMIKDFIKANDSVLVTKE